LTSFPVRIPFMTRWNDNDQYGHVNNTVYYQAMDTAINSWLIAEGGLDPRSSEIALCAASSCEFHDSLAFPEPAEVGIAVDRLGTTSVTWLLGILRPGSATPIADGRFVHVFTDERTRRPTPIPEKIRRAIERTFIV